jgi:transposase
VHLTETCDRDTPHLITHVETTLASISDHELTAPIHQALADKHLLPSEHLVDTGYLDVDLLVSSQDKYGIELVGPLLTNNSWQEQVAQGYAISDFQIDWANERVICPQGKTSIRWTPQLDHQRYPAIRVNFALTDCRSCPAHACCTRSSHEPRRLHLHPPAQHQALQRARAQQQTAEWRERYHQRAGVEGTLSQGIRVSGLRQTRYLGEAKTRLQHVATAVALNVVRLDAWVREKPWAKTRRSHFAALAPAS